jgi:HSP20 family protein
MPAELFRMNPFAFMNPFTLMRRMTEEMDRVFGESGSGQGKGDATAWLPAIEVSERDGNYVVRAELAGLKPEDVKVEVVDNALVLEGERKFEREEDQSGVHRSERRYGLFYRAIPLPEGANVDQAKAKFDNGVLEVTVPVPEQKSNRRQVPIEAGSSGSGGGSQKAA